MTGHLQDQPVVVAVLVAEPVPGPLVDLGTLDDRLGVVSLGADATEDALASVDPDCVVVAADDRLPDLVSVVGSYDAELPVFVYRDDTATSTPGGAAVSADGSTDGGSPTPAVTGVLTRSELLDALEAADGAETPGGIAPADTPVARIVSAMSTYRMPDDVRLRDIALDAVSVGVTITDPTKPDNPLVYVNEQFTRLTGYPEHEILGRNCRFLQGPDTDSEAVTELRQAVDGGRPAFVELQNYRKDGTPFRNELEILPVTDDGEVQKFLGLQRDVTQRHQRAETETRLAEARRTGRRVARDGSRPPGERVESLLTVGREALGVGNAHLVSVDRERDRHEIVRADGSSAFERGDTTALSESYCRHSLDDSAAFAFHDPAEAALDGDPAHERHGAGCYLSEPVYCEDALYGTLCFADESPRSAAFTEAEQQFAALLATHVGRLLARTDDPSLRVE
jgi:PAS domain S-box-containing protein